MEAQKHDSGHCFLQQTKYKSICDSIRSSLLHATRVRCSDEDGEDEFTVTTARPTVSLECGFAKFYGNKRSSWHCRHRRIAASAVGVLGKTKSKKLVTRLSIGFDSLGSIRRIFGRSAAKTNNNTLNSSSTTSFQNARLVAKIKERSLPPSRRSHNKKIFDVVDSNNEHTGAVPQPPLELLQCILRSAEFSSMIQQAKSDISDYPSLTTLRCRCRETKQNKVIDIEPIISFIRQNYEQSTDPKIAPETLLDYAVLYANHYCEILAKNFAESWEVELVHEVNELVLKEDPEPEIRAIQSFVEMCLEPPTLSGRQATQAHSSKKRRGPRSRLCPKKLGQNEDDCQELNELSLDVPAETSLLLQLRREESVPSVATTLASSPQLAGDVSSQERSTGQRSGFENDGTLFGMFAGINGGVPKEIFSLAKPDSPWKPDVRQSSSSEAVKKDAPAASLRRSPRKRLRWGGGESESPCNRRNVKRARNHNDAVFQNSDGNNASLSSRHRELSNQKGTDSTGTLRVDYRYKGGRSLPGDKDALNDILLSGQDASRKLSWKKEKLNHTGLLKDVIAIQRKHFQTLPTDVGTAKSLTDAIESVLRVESGSCSSAEEEEWERKAQIKAIKEYNRKADQEKIEKKEHEEERVLLQRQYDYVNRGKKKRSPEDAELSQLELRPICINTEEESPDLGPCKSGPNCTFCARLLSVENIKEKQAIFNPRFRKVSLDDLVDPDDHVSGQKRRRPRRSADLGLQKKESVDKLKEIHNKLEFIDKYNRGLIYTAPTKRR